MWFETWYVHSMNRYMLGVWLLNHPSSSYATSRDRKLYRRKGFYFTHAMSHKKHTIPSTETQRYLGHCIDSPNCLRPRPFWAFRRPFSFQELVLVSTCLTCGSSRIPSPGSYVLAHGRQRTADSIETCIVRQDNSQEYDLAGLSTEDSHSWFRRPCSTSYQTRAS